MQSPSVQDDSHLWEVYNLLTVQVNPEPLDVNLHF